jgi:hypothetical protein
MAMRSRPLVMISEAVTLEKLGSENGAKLEHAACDDGESRLLLQVGLKLMSRR